MNTKKAYEEAARWEKELQITAVPAGEDGSQNVREYILEKLFQEIALQIYKRDKNGELEYDSKGNPKIDWLGIVTGLAKLVGKIIFLRRAYFFNPEK